MKMFSTKGLCADYINRNNLNAIPMAVYGEDDGEIIGWYVYYVD